MLSSSNYGFLKSTLRSAYYKANNSGLFLENYTLTQFYSIAANSLGVRNWDSLKLPEANQVLNQIDHDFFIKLSKHLNKESPLKNTKWEQFLVKFEASSSNVFEFYHDVISQVAKHNKLSSQEELELCSTFFYTLLESRINNNALKYDGLLFNKDFIEEHASSCIQSFNENTFNEISYEDVITKFQDRLHMIQERDNNTFELKGFTVSLKEAEESTIQISNNKLIKNIASNITQIFKVDLLPIELYVVLVGEIKSILFENKELFISSNKTAIVDLSTKIILGQVQTTGKRITLQNGSFNYRHTPPDKKDFFLNMQANTFDPVSSLRVFTTLFGDKQWYKQFIFYDKKNIKSYFSFSEEPHIKVDRHNRSYEEVTLQADVSEFLSDTNRENFFNIWEKRLSKKDQAFFQEFIKPKIVTGCKEIELSITKKPKKLKKILMRIWDCSSFKFEYNNIFGSANIITSLNSYGHKYILGINESLYRHETSQAIFE